MRWLLVTLAVVAALGQQEAIVIEHVSVIDAQTGTVKPDQTISIKGIAARRIDGRGKFVANGIVGVREMACSQKNWPAQQAHRKRNVAPYLVSTIGPIDRDGLQAVPNAAAAPVLIDRLAKLGVDFLKVYNALSREAFFAIAAEARRRNLPLTGQIPDAVSAAEAARAPQKSIEHMDNILLACSTSEVGYRKLFVQDGRLPKP